MPLTCSTNLEQNGQLVIEILTVNVCSVERFVYSSRKKLSIFAKSSTGHVLSYKFQFHLENITHGTNTNMFNKFGTERSIGYRDING